MKVIVTGSAGFIGKHVMRVASDAHNETFGLDRVGACGIDLDRLDPVALKSKSDAYAPHAVIHCAAVADVRRNWENLADVERDNITATLRTLDAARQSEMVRSFVFVSSGAVYANSNGLVDESTPCVATSPYAASKLTGEAYVQAYAEKCGWRWYVVRPAACFGKGYHHGHIADFVTQAKRDRAIHALDQGSSRPALHVEDLAETLVSFATGDYPSGIYNATGGMWSWLNTAAIMGVPSFSGKSSSGWIGDSKGALWVDSKLARIGLGSKRQIGEGVRDSLRSLGWGTP